MFDDYESQQTNEQIKFIQEVVSPEVSKMNHTVINKKQGHQMQFFVEKRLKKGNGFITIFLSAHQTHCS